MNQPNIVWVFADQMRGQAMSCAGDPNVRTPTLDRMAAEGVRCENAFSSYPLCIPFRFTLLTGEYAHTRWIPALNWRMSPVERTIAHEFNDAGYDTLYVGKWHLNGTIPLTSAREMNRTPILPGYRGGFREWHGFNLRNGYYDTCCFHGDDPTPVPLGKYQTDGLFDIAIDSIQAKRSSQNPFFMVLSVEAPHPPHEAPPEALERVKGRDLQHRPNWRIGPEEDPNVPYPPGTQITEENWREMTTGYYAQVENLDDNMGRLLDTLEESGRLDNTIVFFFSDHGEMLGSHGLRAKQMPYEESINIPFLVYDGRGTLPANRVVSELVCTEDIYPTTMAVANLPSDDAKPGLNLLPVLSGAEDSLGREGVYLELVEEDRHHMVFHRLPWRAYRTKRHKYSTIAGRPWQLFDLHEDPYEQRNLVDSPAHRTLRADLDAALRRIAAESEDSYRFATDNARSD